jgi:hypothetical protein
MAIVLNNGVTNVNGTPGINSDVFLNRPAATDVASGSIYIATDTGDIYQSNGASWSTIGGGGGSTPGIDSVLAVGQLFTTARTIDANNNTFNIDNVNNFRVKGATTNIFSYTSGIGARVQDDSSLFNVNTNGMLTSAPAGGGSVSQQGFSFVWSLRSFSFGVYGLGGNRSKIDILDTSQQIYFSNKGTTNGVYCDFSNKFYSFGRLNTGSELNIEIDEVTANTRTKYAGIINGFNLDYTASVFQFGFLDTFTSNDTYINVNGNNNTIQAVYNGVDNGLNINFDAGNRLFQLGDYQGTFNGSKINVDDLNNSILISSSQVAGSTTIEGNQLIFNGANLQSNTSSSTSGEHLVITLNGVVYHIELKNP